MVPTEEDNQQFDFLLEGLRLEKSTNLATLSSHHDDYQKRAIVEGLLLDV